VSWWLVGRAWLLWIAVTILSVVGAALFSLANGSGLVAGTAVVGWWLASVAIGIGLTSSTVWSVVRDRVLLRPRSGS
jgi:hypothetical protein